MGCKRGEGGGGGGESFSAFCMTGRQYCCSSSLYRSKPEESKFDTQNLSPSAQTPRLFQRINERIADKIRDYIMCRVKGSTMMRNKKRVGRFAGTCGVRGRSAARIRFLFVCLFVSWGGERGREGKGGGQWVPFHTVQPFFSFQI